jgi:outer membrane protein assembly factor BamB
MPSSHRYVIASLCSLCVLLLASSMVSEISTSTVFAAGPVITLSKQSGPPTTAIAVKGSGFGTGETIVIVFDTTVIGKTQANGVGIFSTQVNIPASALPGSHTIKATGKTSDLKAKAPFLVQTNWDMFGFDTHHTHDNPYENVLNSSNVVKLTLNWSGGAYAGGVDNTPIVVNGVVYVGATATGFYALDASTGKTLWSRNIGSILGTPAVVKGIVYVNVTEPGIYALDAATGNTIWYVSGGSDCAPTIINNTVYVGNGNTIDAINATTGALLWNYTTGGEVNSSPVVTNGAVYVGSDDGSIYAFNAKSGTLLWTYATQNAVYSSPAIANGVLYVGSNDGSIYAISLATHTLLWRGITGGPVHSSPAVAHNIVYVGSDDGNLYAVNATTGQLIWNVTTGNTVTDAPTVANGVVYFGSWDQNVYAVNAKTGVVLWKVYTNGAVQSSVTVVNGNVYFGADNYSNSTFQVEAFHVPEKSV